MNSDYMWNLLWYWLVGLFSEAILWYK